MQLAASVRTELNVILTDAPRLMTGRIQIGTRLPSAVAAGEPFGITVDGPPGLGIMAVISPLCGSGGPVRRLAKTADDHYQISVGPMPAGLYNITITRSSSIAAQVDEVSDTVLIYSEADSGEQ
jgi:hypothetical protein